MPDWRVIQGDVLACLGEMSGESVHCVVTSPPYWGLRDYGVEGQIGLEPTPDLCVERMVGVFREVRRVLRKDGTLWLNMGDSYTGGGRGEGTEDCKQRTNKGSLPDHLRSFSRGVGAKPKDLLGMPWRLAFALQADGWWLRCDIVWSKPNPMPESCTDRPTKAHEYLFLLTKSGAALFWTHRDHEGSRTQPKPDYRWVDQAAAYLYAHRDNLHGKTIAATFKELGFDANLSGAKDLAEHTEEPPDWRVEPFPKVPKGWPPAPSKKRWKRINLWRGHDYYYDAEAIREAAVYGDHTRHVDCLYTAPGQPTQSGLHKAGPGRQAGRNKRSVWEIATQPYPEAHFATFPEKLVEPCVKAGTSERGCCAKCGAGWRRVIERTSEPDPSAKGSRFDKGKTAIHQLDRAQEGERLVSRTTGWCPTCECNGGTKNVRAPYPSDPCTILDPFCGSGTTGAVALRLGRSFIGIELNAEYCKLARRRIGEAAPLFAKEAPQ